MGRFKPWIWAGQPQEGRRPGACWVLSAHPSALQSQMESLLLFMMLHAHLCLLKALHGPGQRSSIHSILMWLQCGLSCEDRAGASVSLGSTGPAGPAGFSSSFLSSLPHTVSHFSSVCSSPTLARSHFLLMKRTGGKSVKIQVFCPHNSEHLDIGKCGEITCISPWVPRCLIPWPPQRPRRAGGARARTVEAPPPVPAARAEPAECTRTKG